MKIALIGARGSGKTKLATDIINNFKDAEFNVVDNYIDRFEKQTDLATAQYGTYIVNMQVAMWRLNEELEAHKWLDTVGDCLITCGTIVDTSIYHAMNSYALAGGDGPDLSGRLLNDPRALQTMTWFYMCLVDTWNYDHVFVLRLEEPDPETDAVAAMFDNHVLEACDSFALKYDILEGNDEAKAKKALEIVSASLSQQ